MAFASVNRWENGQATPSAMAVAHLETLERASAGAALAVAPPPAGAEPRGPVDFGGDPRKVALVTEAARLRLGHLVNPAFATELSLIEALPHQRIAVYDQMLPQPRLRFLLADDAGAGKTIMAGLYIREMLARGLIRRVLVVAPAGLIGNWASELGKLFALPFTIVTGGDARLGNPFAGTLGDRVIVSVDTLAGERMFARLQEDGTEPYDLVIFDEAHKLAVDREQDFRLRKTDRYRLAEALAGVAVDDARWSLHWAARHFVLLTATPHMGKDFPYYGLWRLLEPEVLSTYEAFKYYPAEARARHFLRRTKEDMVRFDGTPIYPRRVSSTLSYDLITGDVSEQRLYDETTAYIQHHYNRARVLNRSAAQLAMSVFQRRLASSTYALLRSFERRLEKLETLIADIDSGRMRADELAAQQRRLEAVRDLLDETTADEEAQQDGREEHEQSEDDALGGVTASSLRELESERTQVITLLDLARNVCALEEESKLAKLREVIRDPAYRDERIIIFTEHRDTLEFLVRRLEGLGFTGHVACIHGGLDYVQRQAQIEFFRRPASDGGATYLVATDAAGEGINLQFCWLMVNYDIPWNPARLEQRMGRIHRYGQARDPVVIVNLVAGKTREGHVLQILLEKLERIRKELGNDKVFDVVGRLFQGVSLKDFMVQALTPDGAVEVERRLEGTLTTAQVQAIAARERALYGDGGDVRSALPRLRPALEQEAYRRLLPGYVRRFIENAAPLLGLGLEDDTDGSFRFSALAPGALDALLPILEAYPTERRNRLTVHKPRGAAVDEALFLHPGEPVFDRLSDVVSSRFGGDALRGARFVDPAATEPYILHIAAVRVIRRDDEAAGSGGGLLELRLAGLRDNGRGLLEECPVEGFLLLRPAPGAGAASPLLTEGDQSRERAEQFALERIATPLAERRRGELAATLAERESFIRRGFDYQEAELAASRTKLRERSLAGDARAQADMERIRDQQRSLDERRARAIKAIREEVDRVAPGPIEFIAHALVMPSQASEDVRQRDLEIERIAVALAEQCELAAGAIEVRDVSAPEGARAAGLQDHPGFDLLARHPGGERRCIEVKGRAAIGDIEVTENEWARSANLREEYWLYVVYDCASAHPRLVRVRDPFHALLVRAKGGVIIDESAVFAAAEGD